MDYDQQITHSQDMAAYENEILPRIHIGKPMYDYLRTRLRAEKRLGITPCVRCASNPGGPGHAWVKARFVDATGAGQRVAEATVESSILGGVSVRRIEYIPATAMDNPHITRDYIVELEQKPKALRDALLLGKWDAFDGQAFRSLWTIRRITRTGYTRTSSNRSKFHGTGRGWSASTTDIRGLFLLAFGRWTRRDGFTDTRSSTAACRGGERRRDLPARRNCAAVGRLDGAGI